MCRGLTVLLTVYATLTSCAVSEPLALCSLQRVLALLTGFCYLFGWFCFLLFLLVQSCHAKDVFVQELPWRWAWISKRADSGDVCVASSARWLIPVWSTWTNAHSTAVCKGHSCSPQTPQGTFFGQPHIGPSAECETSLWLYFDFFFFLETTVTGHIWISS